jgi:hypothetical protein
MTPPTDWPRHMTRIARYGRLAVGQRVRWERLASPPTTAATCNWLAGDVEPVTLRTEHTIVDVRSTDTGAAVVLRHAHGAESIAWGVDAYGCQPGSFGQVHVLAEPPEQRPLLRGAAAPAVHAPRSTRQPRSFADASTELITGDLFA